MNHQHANSFSWKDYRVVEQLNISKLIHYTSHDSLMFSLSGIAVHRDMYNVMQIVKCI